MKALFTAAFPMYGPMPYLLETALADVYQRRGWDLIIGLNIHEGPGDGQFQRELLFPTLEELYDAVDRVASGAGYSKDLTSDIRTALKMRVGSLMAGAKGQVLGVRQRLQVEDLLSRPTVIELEFIGDGSEKVFLMGLLLIQVYEYYMAGRRYRQDLGHLLVVEEAHRLWENRQEAGSQEVADVKGYAVQTMNHLLSEIRDYGQGVVIADQIPARLAPDVVKNTNIKILHRIFAQDDREWVGRAIGLNDEQVQDLVHLRRGEAIVFWDRLDAAVKARIEVAPELTVVQPGAVSEERAEPAQARVNLLLANRPFIQSARCLVRTALLLPRLEPFARVRLARLAESHVGGVITAGAAEQIWAQTAVHFVRAWQLAQMLPLTHAWELEEGLRHGDWAAFGTAFEQICSAAPRSAMSRLCPVSTRLRPLLPEGWANDERETALLRLIKQGLSGGAPLTISDYKRLGALARPLGLPEVLALDLLSYREGTELADAAVLCLLAEAAPTVAEYYFEVCDHHQAITPAPTVEAAATAPPPAQQCAAARAVPELHHYWRQGLEQMVRSQERHSLRLLAGVGVACVALILTIWMLR